jgi:glycosyltransferase involved in cell wall biosynthesis
MNSEVKATVTIGMPVHNAASTIGAALDSLLNQTRRDFVLVISDNASSDDTEAICREYVTQDHRIRYLRQSRNLGGAMNFRCVLFEARTPYFMWAAGDDLWAPTFIERTVAFLEAHPDYVCCQSRVLFTVNGRARNYSTGTYSLSEQWDDNVVRFFRGPGDCSRFYGMFRTSALQAVFPSRVFHALDWAVCAGTLKFGRHAELHDVLMIRDESPISNYQRQLRDEHSFVLWRIFPVLFMTVYCMRHKFIPVSLRSFRVLVRLNLDLASRIGPYRFVRIGLHLAAALARHLKTYKDWQASAPVLRGDGASPGPALPVGNWRTPAPLAGKSAQLAIIIVASDVVDFTLALLDSIANGQSDIPLEIIICDLGIGDVTTLLWQRTDNIRCIRCDPLLTYAAAANIAIRAVTAPIIGFFDQKDLVEPGAIRELLKGMTDSISLIGPQGDGDVCPHAYLARQELIANLDGFDEAFATFEMAQADLALRAREAGRRFLYWPAAKIVTYVQQSDRHHKYPLMDVWSCDVSRIFDKHGRQISQIRNTARQ